MRRDVLSTLMAMAGLLALAAGAWASGPAVPASGVAQIIDNDTVIDANNILMFVTNHGSWGWNLKDQTAGTEFPRGSGKTVIFASGIWLAAKVNGQTRVALGEYSQEFDPGIIEDDGQPANKNDPRFRVYKIVRGEEWSEDYEEWPFEDGAPADTTDPAYDPDDPSTWKPLLLGDQTLWCVYNEANPEAHSHTAGGTAPLGVEVRQTIFAFSRSGIFGNMIFAQFEIENKGTDVLDSMYVTIFCDADVGQFDDDLVGCDTTLSLGYCYNEGADGVYGTAVPAVGYDFFKGPRNTYGLEWPPGSGRVPDYLPLTAFKMYINADDPSSSSEAYNLMRGLEKDGTPVLDPEGNPTTFEFTGDPYTGEGWLDSGGADRRFLMSTGPFRMEPGAEEEIVVAIIVARAGDPLSSVRLLKEYDEKAQMVFDINFQLPPAPPSPSVYAIPYDGEIELVWGTEADDYVATSEILDEEYVFQGFNIYQGLSEFGPWKKLATFDIPDSFALIYGDVFSSDAGGIETIVLASGSNSGLVHRMKMTRDEFGGGPLVNYKEYYYAVQSYGVEIRHAEPHVVGMDTLGYKAAVLPSPMRVVTVMPKSSAAVLSDQAEHVAGMSDGSVEIIYVDQEAIVPHEYRVTFLENPDSNTVESIPFVWNLEDLTTGEVLLSLMTDQSKDPVEPVTNGFICNVLGPKLAIKSWNWEGPDEEAERWLTGVNWGGSGFYGGVGLGEEFFGSTLTPPDYSKTIEIRFTTDQSQWSDCQTYRRDQDYSAGGIGQFPGSAWDVTGETPRRLNICFVENETDQKPANRYWDPDSTELGGREYLFIMNSDYNGGADYGDGSEEYPGEWGPAADVLVGAWVRVRAEHEFLESPATWTIALNRINTTDDVFEFKTYPPGMVEGTVVQNVMDRIKVVPNPYLNTSSYELNQFDRVIRFINLPATKCTIRIFNLAGELIRTLVKEDPVPSWIRWDLLTENGVPVASGIYIYHVEAEGIGTKVGKMAVFVEKERLNTF
jgi:hypothetical protein